MVTLVRAVVVESIIPNRLHAVPNGHAGEAVVPESIIPNGRNAVGYSAIHHSLRNHYISGSCRRRLRGNHLHDPLPRRQSH